MTDPADLISVRSTAHMSVQIADDVVIHGRNHPKALNGEMLTHNVPRAAFEAWRDRMGPQPARAARCASEGRPAVPAQPPHELHGMLAIITPPITQASKE